MALSEAFQAWREAIGAALGRLRENRLLAADADLETLTTMTLAAIQGGLLLAKTSRDSGQLRAAFDGPIAQLHAHDRRGATSPAPQGEDQDPGGCSWVFPDADLLSERLAP